MKKNDVFGWQLFNMIIMMMIIGWIIGGVWAVCHRFDTLNNELNRAHKIENDQLQVLNSVRTIVNDDHFMILSLQARLNELNNAFIEDGIKVDRRLYIIEHPLKTFDRVKPRRNSNKHSSK